MIRSEQRFLVELSSDSSCTFSFTDDNRVPAGAERPAAHQHEEHGDVGGERGGRAARPDLRPATSATQPGGAT